MNPFTFYTPTEVLFGKGTETEVGRLIRKYGGSRVLIHYGGQSAVRSGLIDRVKHALDEAGIFHVELGGVVPNPLLSKVREGFALCLENKVDFLLAIGGGSVIDSAKAIAYALYEPDKDVWDLFEKKRSAAGCLPVGSILTIAAAGSEMSNSCVITNGDTQEKRSYNDDIIRAKFTIMNPELTLTLPDYQTAAGCADMMMHTMERYFVKGDHMEITDALAEGLLRTVMTQARILHKDPQNCDARAEVMWASSLAHNGLTGPVSDGTSHALEHELGGVFNVTHGAGLTAIWGSWARYVYRNNLPRFVRFATNAMGIVKQEGMSDEDVALKGIEAMEDFYRSIDMPTSLTELGIAPSEQQILWMAASLMRSKQGKVGSAMVLNEEDVANIYRSAL